MPEHCINECHTKYWWDLTQGTLNNPNIAVTMIILLCPYLCTPAASNRGTWLARLSELTSSMLDLARKGTTFTPEQVKTLAMTFCCLRNHAQRSAVIPESAMYTPHADVPVFWLEEQVAVFVTRLVTQAIASKGAPLHLLTPLRVALVRIEKGVDENDPCFL